MIGIDNKREGAWIDGEFILLTPTEWRLFKLLYAADGFFIERGKLEGMLFCCADTLRGHIMRLHVKLGDNIESQRGHGTRLNI